MPEPKRPARGQALKRIMELWNAGVARPTAHWVDRSLERGFDNLDARKALETGRIVEEGEWTPKYRNFKWRIEGRDVEDREFRLVVAYGEDSEVLYLISGMRKETGRWQAE